MATTRKIAATAFAACLLIPVAGLPAQASGTPAPECGGVVTADMTLMTDLLLCPGDGLVVIGDDITLDLNGHTVSGDGVANADGFDVGIRVSGRNTKVVGGSITAFDRGLWAVSSPGIRLSRLLVRNNTNRGLMVDQGSDDARIEHNDSSDNGASGIAVVESNGAWVIGNRSMRNIGGAGVRLQRADGATAKGNAFNGNTFGVQIDPDADGNLVTKNSLLGDVDSGVVINFSNDNVVTRNRIAGAGGGVTTESADRTVVTDNVIVHSNLTACDGCGIGIQIYGNDSLVARNTVLDSPRYGIEVDDFQDPGRSPATGNVLQDNVVDGSGIGIAIGPEAGGVVVDTVIARNLVTNAAGDGIQLLGPSTGLQTSTLTRNRANHNGGFGIVTVPGTQDGGGNRAAGNGNPAQCLNIVCQ